MTEPRPGPTPPAADQPPSPAPPPPQPEPQPQSSAAAPAGPGTPPGTGTGGYSSSVVAPAQIGLGVLLGAVLAATLVALGLWPLAVIGFVVVVAVSVYLATVAVTVTTEHVVVAQGRGDHNPLSYGADEIVDAAAITLTWPQCFGIGVPEAVESNRFTVRGGPTLSLTLRDGELVRISTPDPRAALAALGRGSGSGG